MRHFVGKPTMWFPNRSDTNRPIQQQKQARSLKFWDYVEKELYYPRSENKGVISFAVTAKLICAFVFAYANCWFSHRAAQMYYAPYSSFALVAEWFRALNHSTISPLCLV